MDTNSSFGLFGDSAAVMAGLLIFLAAATLAFALMSVIRAREAVRRRATRVGLGEESFAGRRSLRYSGLKAAQKLVDYTAKHYSSLDGKDMKRLRRRLVQAGIYDSHAAAYFFIARTAMAVGVALASFCVLQMLGMHGKTPFWLLVMAGGLCGYLAPSVYLDRRVAAKRLEHQAGFPDFMDLLVVCADAGLAMEAALERVGRELSDSYPSLAANIHMANLEIPPVVRSQRRLITSATASALKRRAPSPPSSNSPTNSAPVSAARCASTAKICDTSACRAPRRRPTACRPSSRCQ